jgi:hypothetical protein
MRNRQAGVLQERYKMLEREVECSPFRRESERFMNNREAATRHHQESGEGVPRAPVALETAIRDQGYAIALAAVLATPAGLRTTIRIMNVVTVAAIRRAAGNRKRRGAVHQEASSAHRFATFATRGVAPGLDRNTVIALPAPRTRRARRCQYEPESGESEADGYCYCSYQHGAHRKECEHAAPWPF